MTFSRKSRTGNISAIEGDVGPTWLLFAVRYRDVATTMATSASTATTPRSTKSATFYLPTLLCFSIDCSFAVFDYKSFCLEPVFSECATTFGLCVPINKVTHVAARFAVLEQ